jgi:hypothetical protein
VDSGRKNHGRREGGRVYKKGRISEGEAGMLRGVEGERGPHMDAYKGRKEDRKERTEGKEETSKAGKNGRKIGIREEGKDRKGREGEGREGSTLVCE